MKQLLLYIFLFINATAFGQNAIAELKFEEAETAYNKGDYELTLKKVQEYEKAKGNTTAKALFLRIVAQAKLFNANNFYTDENQLTLYTSLNENAAKYLKAMENEGLDDKYREVYAISEKLKDLNLPKDKENWQKGKAFKEAKDLMVKNTFASFNFHEKYTAGENIEVTREKYNLKRSSILDYNRFKGANAYRTGYKRLDLGEYVFTYNDSRGKKQMQVLFYYFNDQAVAYEYLWGIDDDAHYSSGTSQIEKEKIYYTTVFGFEPEKGARASDPKDVNYTWQLAEKTFRIKLITIDGELNRAKERSIITYEGFDSLKAFEDLK